jgi:hypothetical protein
MNIRILIAFLCDLNAFFHVCNHIYHIDHSHHIYHMGFFLNKSTEIIYLCLKSFNHKIKFTCMDLYNMDHYNMDRYNMDRYNMDHYDMDHYDMDRYDMDRYDMDGYDIHHHNNGDAPPVFLSFYVSKNVHLEIFYFLYFPFFFIKMSKNIIVANFS